MIVYHVSPSYNDTSIRERGILTACSRLAHGRIYLVERDMVEWAVGHVLDRHRCEAVSCWTVKVHKRRLQQCFLRYWHTAADIEPHQIAGKLVVLANGKSLI